MGAAGAAEQVRLHGGAQPVPVRSRRADGNLRRDRRAGAAAAAGRHQLRHRPGALWRDLSGRNGNGLPVPPGRHEHLLCLGDVQKTDPGNRSFGAAGPARDLPRRAGDFVDAGIGNGVAWVNRKIVESRANTPPKEAPAGKYPMKYTARSA